MSVIGAVDGGEVVPSGLGQHAGDRILLRGGSGGEFGRGGHGRREVREVVLPFHPSVGPDPRVEVDAALGRLARPAEPEGERPVHELVARGPIRRPGEELPDLRRTGIRVDAGRDVDDHELVHQIGAGCRDRCRGESAERLADQQLRAACPRIHPGGDVGCEDAAGVREVGAPRRVAVAGQVDRERRADRGRGSSYPTCARSIRHRAGRSPRAARPRSAVRSACARPRG